MVNKSLVLIKGRCLAIRRVRSGSNLLQRITAKLHNMFQMETDNQMMVMLILFQTQWFRNSFLLAHRHLPLEEELVCQKMRFSLPLSFSLYLTWSNKILLVYVGINFAFPLVILKITIAFFTLILNFMKFLHLHFRDHSFVLVDIFTYHSF